MSDVPEVVEAPEPIAVPEPVEVSEPVDVSEPVYVPEAAETPAAAQDDLPAAEIEVESEVPAAVPTFVDISITNEDVGSSLPPIPSMDDPVEETPASAADNLPWPAITQDEVSEEIGLDAPSTNDAFPSLEDAPPNAESEEPNDEQT